MLCEPLVLSGLECEGAVLAPQVRRGQCGECGMEHSLPLTSPGDLATQQTCHQDTGRRENPINICNLIITFR